VLKARLARAWKEWKARDVTSTRLLGTAVGLVLLGVPMGLWGLVVGPTAKDRLMSLGIVVVVALAAAYSVWESKAPGGGRPGRYDDEP
jgi:hypothetical protein